MYVGAGGREVACGQAAVGAAMYQQAADFVARRPCLGTSFVRQRASPSWRRLSSCSLQRYVSLSTPVSPPSNRKPLICTRICMCAWCGLRVGGGGVRLLLSCSSCLSLCPPQAKKIWVSASPKQDYLFSRCSGFGPHNWGHRVQKFSGQVEVTSVTSKKQQETMLRMAAASSISAWKRNGGAPGRQKIYAQVREVNWSSKAAVTCSASAQRLIQMRPFFISLTAIVD